MWQATVEFQEKFARKKRLKKIEVLAILAV
jgi:hypothetical protein